MKFFSAIMLIASFIAFSCAVSILRHDFLYCNLYQLNFSKQEHFFRWFQVRFDWWLWALCRDDSRHIEGIWPWQSMGIKSKAVCKRAGIMEVYCKRTISQCVSYYSSFVYVSIFLWILIFWKIMPIFVYQFWKGPKSDNW